MGDTRIAGGSSTVDSDVKGCQTHRIYPVAGKI